MQHHGTIIKVAGPLVVATGMKNAKMYEVARVGKERLVGEVIRLNGELAAIQVYEETAGVGPGEPVELTGETMTVDLGPGLLTSIYDGIQRPLAAIEAKVGPFITRGVEVPGLDYDKKWDFKATAQKGDNVMGGDILGTIQETTLIEHRIMVPPHLSGTLKSIKGGSHTVKDVIAEVEDGEGTVHEITMLQKWPIRIARPVKTKKVPNVPLKTGGRSIDTFFTLAKGGTAAIPGPFGAGKCVDGDTPILTDKGLIKIRNLYAKHHHQGIQHKKAHETYTELTNPIMVYSQRNDQNHPEKATVVYKGMTDRMVEVTTRLGRTVKVTPVHKLFKANGELGLEEIPAEQLKVGDHLAVPRYLELEGNNPLFALHEICPEARVTDKKIITRLPQILAKAMENENIGNLKSLAIKLNIKAHSLRNYKNGITHPPLHILKKLYDLADKTLSVTRLKSERRSHSVNLPKRLSPELAEFLGLILSDGGIKGKASVHFYNNDKKLLNRFEQLSKKLFTIECKRGYARTVHCTSFNSRLIIKYLHHLDVPLRQKSRTCSVPSILFSATEKNISAFLRGYFLGDGYASKDGKDVYFYTASIDMCSGLSYLFTRIGLLGGYKEKKMNNRTYYSLNIIGKESIARFYKYAALPQFAKFKRIASFLKKEKQYDTLDTVPLNANFLKKIYEKHGSPYTKLKKFGIEIHNYLTLGERMSRKVFKKMAQAFEDPLLMSKASNGFDHIYFDEIVSIRVIRKAQEVFDVTVPETHNFIGGQLPIYLHNTVTQQALAKFCDAQIIVYIGCGERGNEMTEVLVEFPHLEDPNTGEPLMKRTILIANTSNMPVAAREASVYTGITIAEYYRDMGYDVALMADSTSRWAEAMREMGGRLEEMPGEEGYPAYLASRIAAFYERAGYVDCVGTKNREGSLSVIGAVSPPGGDFSEPVTQNTLRVVKTFWGLDSKLAYARHYPSINWLSSYTLYADNIESYLRSEIAEDYPALRNEAMDILQQEAKLQELVRLVGADSLSAREQLLLLVSKSIREDFLFQNAFDKEDARTPLKKQYWMLKAILSVYHAAKDLVANETFDINELKKLEILQKVSKVKDLPADDEGSFKKLIEEVHHAIQKLS